MFGSSSNTPFGTGTGFGTGTTFGGQTTGTQFGSGTGLGTSIFGNKTQTNFGSTLNQPQSSGTTSLFGGGTTTNTGGSLFGGTTSGSLFGQQQTAQSTFPSFGGGSSGLFGGTTKSTAGTSVFPTPGQTSTFGSGTSSGFGTTGSSLFGGSANTGGSLFGSAQPTSNSSLFGTTSTSSGFQGLASGIGNTGTSVKFTVVTGNDSVVKNGAQQTISTRHQCITVMPTYSGKSLEELRIEDYEAGRKSGATGTTAFTGLPTATSSSAGSLFGNTSTGFGTTAFGQKSTAGFGGTGSLFGSTATPSLFGQQQQQQTPGSVFGQKPGGLFGTPTSSSASSGFGTGFGTGSTLFGQSSSGQTSSLFGTTTTSAPTGLFGTQTTGFGQTQTGTGLFGQTGFGQTQQQSSMFGTKPFGTALGTGSTGSLFGQQNKSQTGFNFGGTPGGLGVSAFGTTTSTAGSLFGPKPTGFGTGTVFGSTTGTGLFGNTGTLGTATGIGSGTLGTSTFGSLGTQQTPVLGINALGSNQNTAALNALQQQQQQLLEQQLQILSNSPFGDSPLFRNSLVEKARAERASSSTSSSLQRVSTTPSHYKVCPRSAARIKPRPINNHTINKSKLFEGLEEDSGLSPDTFVPRKNIKKLVIKSKSVTEELPVSAIDTTRVKIHTLEGDDDVIATSTTLPPSPQSSQYTSPIMTSTVSKSVAFREDLEGRSTTSDTTSPIGVRFSQGTGTESLDTTIADLNVRRIRAEDDQESLATSDNTEDTSSVSGTRESCAIVLKRSEYYTIPPLNELNQKVDSNGDVFIEDFVVGRTGYGCVKFYGRTNVAGLNLDEIVFFRRREIEVYPDSYPNKPPVGKDLNKKAEITLEKVWPNDKTSHKPITSPERLQLQGWQKRVEAATAKLGATFLDYDPDTGNWVFTVEHFTRYGMHEYLEDEQLAKKLKRPPLKPHLQDDGNSVEKEKLEILKHLQQKKQQFEVYEKEKQKATLSLGDQDSDMADIDHETFPEELLEESAEGASDVDEDELDNSPASHQLASALGMNAQRIQVMKASFFADQSRPTQSLPLPKDAPSVNKSFMSSSFSKGGHVKSSMYPGLMPLGPLLSPKVQRSMDESPVQGQLSQSLFGSPKIGVYPLRHPLVREVTSAAPPSPMLLPSAIGTAMDVGIKVVGARNQFGLVPKEDSLVNHKENLVGDAGLMMGRSFRVGWGPGFLLVHSGFPMGTQEKISVPADTTTQTTLMGDLLSPKTKPRSSASAFRVTIEKLNVASHFSQGRDIVLARHQSVLETELSQSVLSVDDGFPFFRPSTNVEALHNHAEVARKNMETIVSEPLRGDAEQTCLVWDLMVALWGRLKEIPEDEEDLPSVSEDRETYHMRIARKEALSNWLAEAAKAKIVQEVDSANFQESDHLKSIFSYLTGRQISKACHVAQHHNEYRLSLLLSQATGNSLPRNLSYQQLAEWQDFKADTFINKERTKIYALLAGAMVWPMSRDVASLSCDDPQAIARDVNVNVCEGLDWKRVFAVHMWYHCSPICSIQDALNAYEISFKGSGRGGKYGAPPQPPFMEEHEEYEEEDEVDENRFVTRDTCYHLLKLYCKRSHRLERLLSPSTSTAHQLDFSLSWHLNQVLESLQYTHLSQYHAGMLHTSFAAQLEGLGLWHWATFVLLHLQDPVRRERAVRSLLCRHCSLSADHSNVEKERFMLSDLKIPAEWIHEAKALQARYEGRTREEAFHLVKARHWSLGHNVVLRSLVSDAIINAEYDILKSLLGELEPRDRSSTVKDWATGGQVFLDYLSLVDKFQDIAMGKLEPTKYDFEDIHREVSTLCTRVNSLPSDSTKDMLCQYDMAKMCANFLKIVMKELTDVTDDEEAILPTHVLAPQVTRLPMPEDCALAELRQLIPGYITEITAEH